MSGNEYFVLYDYGQGGLWAIVSADSAETVRRRLPQVTVFDAPPPQLDAAAIAVVRAAGVQPISAGPLTGWLAELGAD
jgi:hypothetical protein